MKFICEFIKTNLEPKINLLVLLLIFSPVITIAAQTCDPGVIPSAPNNRFQDNGDDTITDFHTGLMWQRCSMGLADAGCTSAARFTWGGALSRAKYLNDIGGFAGFSDWRLPNIKELRSLVEIACSNPAINESLFNLVPEWHFSSSPSVSSPHLVWGVNFNNGISTFGARDFYSFHRYAVLVRGGTP